MSFFYTICKFADGGEVTPFERTTLGRIVSEFSLEPTGRDGVYAFRDGEEASEVDLSDAGVIQLPRPLGTENMERFLFDVLALTGGTLFSPQFDGAITTDREQATHVPDDLPPRLVENWQELAAALRGQ
ncbi:hypothetical protein [Nocardia jejuensis]|uniref:hypothetical protein n=1 Tax=Nocardia jejuensis TaxID=328049 RepID=UPI0012FA4FEF|nr:hypothetical protein [Nocardia jejuensis]